MVACKPISPSTSAEADIRIKRIYEPADADDGARVLVDRVWPRGIGKQEAALALWLRDVAPSTALRRWFGHDPARWHEFGRRYRAELHGNEPEIRELCELLRRGRLTLLYAARDSAHNNAIILADYLRDRMREDHGGRAT